MFRLKVCDNTGYNNIGINVKLEIGVLENKLETSGEIREQPVLMNNNIYLLESIYATGRADSKEMALFKTDQKKIIVVSGN